MSTTHRGYELPTQTSLSKSFVDLVTSLTKIDEDMFKSLVNTVDNAVFDSGVVTGDVVYRHTDNVYYKCVDDGVAAKGTMPGIANIELQSVVYFGLAEIKESYGLNTPVYTSAITAGDTTDVKTNIFLGISLGGNLLFKATPDWRNNYVGTTNVPVPTALDEGKPLKVATPYTNGYTLDDTPQLPPITLTDYGRALVVKTDGSGYYYDTPVPTGTIIRATTDDLPGFIHCNGAQLNTADYPTLYSVLGDTCSYYANTYIEGSPWTSQWRTNEEPVETIIDYSILPYPIYGHTVLKLQNGLYLVIGGYKVVDNSTSNFTGYWLFNYAGGKCNLVYEGSISISGINLTGIDGCIQLQDGRLLIYGIDITFGRTAKTYFGTVNLDYTITWTAGSDLPNNYTETSCIEYSTNLLFISGGTHTFTIQNTTYWGTISGTIITWASGTALPESRTGHTCNVLSDGRLFVFGGTNGLTTYRTTPRFGIVSGTSITWSAGSTSPNGIRYNTINFISNSEFLILGGGDVSADPLTYFDRCIKGTISGTTITYKEITNLPLKLGKHSSYYDSTLNKVFLVSGVFASSSVTTYSNIIFVGDVNTNTVSWLTSKNFGSSILGGAIYDTPSEKSIVLDTNEIFSIASAGGSDYVKLHIKNYNGTLYPLITTLTDANVPRKYYGITKLSDGRVLILGGWVSAGVLSSESYFYTFTSGIDGATTSSVATGTNYPVALQCHEVIELEPNRILVVGGTEETNLNDFGPAAITDLSATYFGVISGTTITWTVGTPLPSGLNRFTLYKLDSNKIVVVGNSAAGTPVTLIGVISGTTITWHPTNSPHGVNGVKGAIGLVLDDGRLLLMGGSVGGLNGSYTGTLTKKTFLGTVLDNTVTWVESTEIPLDYLYDKTLNKFHNGDLVIVSTNGGDLEFSLKVEVLGNNIYYTVLTPQSLLNNCSTAMTNSKIYTFGGNDTESRAQMYGLNISSAGVLDGFNPGSLPAAISYSTASLVGNRIYVMGGWTTTAVNTVYYSLVNSDGTLVGFINTSKTLSTAITNSAAIVTKNRLYMIGGSIDKSTPSTVVQSALINPDGTLETNFVAGTSLPFGINNPCVFKTNNRIYVVGGIRFSIHYKSLTAVINADGTLGAWEYAEDAPFSTTFFSPYSIVVNSKVFVFNYKSGTWVIYSANINSDGTIDSWRYESNFSIPELSATQLHPFIIDSKIIIQSVFGQYSIKFEGGKNSYLEDTYTQSVPTAGKFFIPDLRYEESEANFNLRNFIKI